jgi:hypothetical protein
MKECGKERVLLTGGKANRKESAEVLRNIEPRNRERIRQIM